MSSLRDELRDRLAAWRDAGLERTLAVPCGIDFCSNDYLGLAKHSDLRRRVIGALRECPPPSPSSRLLAGHLAMHAELEARLADYKGTEAALLFSTGYQANLGVLGALIAPNDRVLSDELNHASIIDGLRLTRARRVVYPHLRLDALRDEVAKPWPEGRTFVVTESLFSMDGDVAPLDRIAELCAAHDAALIVDDAHATGLWGDARGSGLAERFGVVDACDAIVSTFGKALGFFGAFVAGPKVVVDYLVQRARSFVFTTAPPPEMLCGMNTTLDLAAAEPDRRARVLELAARLRDRLHAAGLSTGASESPIVPVVLGANERALAVAQAARDAGFDVRAIRPPSVAPGTARLRLSVHADHREGEIDELARVIARAAGPGSHAG